MDTTGVIYLHRECLTSQSLRSLHAWADQRGPGEGLSETIRIMLAALDEGHAVRVEVLG